MFEIKERFRVLEYKLKTIQETLEILKSEGQGKLRGVMHCFSYDVAAAKMMFDLGFLTSFTCNVTF